MAFKSLSDLRNSRGSFETLIKEVEKIANPQGQDSRDDDRYWQPTVDKAGNGYAVIRFLPPAPNEELPWVRIFSHGFQGPTGKWYIENSLTTLNQQDPVAELNSELWNSGTEANKEIARKQKRRLTYIANILVISDQGNPENEGKVKLFKFGKKIFDKIKDAMQPEFPDSEPINPFDFWKGANFKLKIRNYEGYRNYDKSEFDSISPVANSDEEIEALWNKQHSLTELVAPHNFKSYDELKKKLDAVLAGASAAPARAEAVELDDEDTSFAKAVTQTKPTPKVTESVSDDEFDNADASLDYFAKLAADD